MEYAMRRKVQKRATKALSLVLCVFMLAASLPLSVFATGTGAPLDELLAQLADYDSLYEKNGLVAWYDFFDAKESDALTSGSTVSFANKVTGGDALTLHVLDTSKKVDNGQRVTWSYGDGYLQISTNSYLQIGDLYTTAGLQDGFSASVLVAYSDSNATPVSATPATSPYGYGDAWSGAYARDSFALGGMSVSTSYLGKISVSNVKELVKAYQGHVAEYESITDSDAGSNNAKDTRIQYLNSCTFRTAAGLTFGDVYYLLHPELEAPVEQTGTGEAYQAKWYTYLTRDDNYYSQWGQGGIVDQAISFGGNACLTVPDNMLAAPYGNAFDLSFAVGNTMTAMKDGEQVCTFDGSAAGSDLVFLRDTAAQLYSLRIYDTAVSEAVVRQNHFADIAKFFELNIFYFLRVPEASRGGIYDAFAGVSLGDLTAKTAQATLDEAIAGLGQDAYDYASLYVTDADGDGESDLIFSFNAFDKTAADGALTSTALTDSLGNAFNAPATSSWGEKHLQTIGGAFDLAALLPTELLGGTEVLGDVTLDVMVAHRERGWNGTWTIGPWSTSVAQDASETSKPIDESYGPVSGCYWGAKNWGTDISWSKGKFMGNTLGVPFHVSVFVDTENSTEADASTYRVGYVRDGAPVSGRSDSGAVSYTPDASHVKMTIMGGMKADVYAIRVYNKVLTSNQLLQNAFADFATMYQLDLAEYDLIAEEGKRAIQSAVALLNAAEYDNKSAQDALNKIISELPASLRFDYEAFYVTDLDGDGVSNLIFDWNALSATAAMNNESGVVPSTTLTDKFGTVFTVGAKASYGDGYLFNGDVNLTLKNAYPTRQVGDTTVPEDLYMDVLLAYEYRIGINASSMQIGHFSMQMQTKYTVNDDGTLKKEETPVDESYGPIAGTYWSGKNAAGTGTNWGTDVYWSKTKFVGNTYGESFYVGFYNNVEVNEENLAASTYQMSYYRDGKCVKGPSHDVVFDASLADNRKLAGFGGLGARIYAVRMYDMPLTEEQAAQNRFADLMKYYGLNTVSYLTGSAAQRDKVNELLSTLSVGSAMRETVQTQYNAIFATATEYTLEDLYLRDKLLFSYNAFDKNAGDDMQTVIDKFGIELNKINTSAAWTYGDGSLVLGSAQNGGLKVTDIIPSVGGYTVQILAAYRSNGRSGMNATDAAVIERPVFSFGSLEVRNTFGVETEIPVRQTSFYVGDTLIGQADAFTDTDTYAGTLLADEAGRVFNLTTTVTRSGTLLSAKNYRNGHFVNEVSGTVSGSVTDLIVGNYADLEIYAIRVYGTRMGEVEIAQNHFADLCNYYGVSLDDYNKLTSDKRAALVEQYADVNLLDTCREELMRAIATELADQMASTAKAEHYVLFDGYSARLGGVPGIRASFTLRKEYIGASDSALTVAEIGVILASNVDNDIQNGLLVTRDDQGVYTVPDGMQKVTLYEGGSYNAKVNADGNATVAVLFDDDAVQNLTAYCADVYYQSYVVLQTQNADGEQVDAVLYGDMSSSLFGDSITAVELTGYLADSYKGASGILHVQKAVAENADGILADIGALAQDVQALADLYAAGDAALLTELRQAAAEALATALSIKQGGKPANQATAESNAQAAANAAADAAKMALRLYEVNMQVALHNAEANYEDMVRLCDMLKTATGEAGINGASVAQAERLLAETQTVIERQLTSSAILTAYDAREDAVTALNAAADVAKENYTANRTFRVLYIGDLRIKDAVTQMEAIAMNLGYDTVTAGLLTTEDYNLAAAADFANTFTYHKLTGGVWIEADKLTLADAVANAKWDAIVLGDDLDAAIGSHSGLASQATTVINKIKTACTAKIYWMQGWSYSERGACALYGDASDHKGTDATRMYADVLEHAAKVSSLVDGVLPTATTIENIRSGAYSDALFIFADGSVLSDLGAYAVGLTMLSKMTNTDLSDLTLAAKGMVEVAVEIGWFKDSVAAAISKPNAMTQAVHYVSDGVHDDNNFVIHGVGQSNMSNGPYFTWLQTYLMTRNPGKNLVFLNEGIPGESVFGTASRVDYVIDAQPDVVILHHGVVNYMGWWFSSTGYTAQQKDEQLVKHEAKLREILTKYRDAGIEVILSNEGVSPGETYNATPDYNMTLALSKLTAIYLKLANETDENGNRTFPNVIAVLNTTEFFGQLVEADDKAPTTIFNSDFVHISNSGGAALAYLYTQTMQDLTTESGVEEFFTDTVADVTIDINGQATAANATVTNVNRSGNTVSYTYLANALPLSANSYYKNVDNLDGIAMADMNKEIIRVSGLVAGNYTIKMDGVSLGTFSAAELAAGVNIAELANNPGQVQAQQVYNYVNKKASAESTLNRLDYCLFSFYGAGFIDREYNFLYNEKEGRYYNDADLSAYATSKSEASSGWYSNAMRDCYLLTDPDSSLMATRAQNQAIVNRYTYLAQQAAIPVQHAVEIAPAS